MPSHVRKETDIPGTDLLAYQLVELIRQHSSPLEPASTGLQPVLKKLPDVRAVLFDIYGTLFVSGSGDIGLTSDQQRAEAFVKALQAVGLEWKDEAGEEGACLLRRCIEEEHERLRAQGVEYPEIEILEIWKKTLNLLVAAGKISSSQRKKTKDGSAAEMVVEPDRLRRLAVHFELAVNPVWPMPECACTLETLKAKGMVLGVVSNAQFFTPLLFPALLGKSLTELGVAPSLRLFSFEHRQAKPGTFLYKQAKTVLQRDFGIQPQQVLYVGNDMKNDVAAAAAVGFRTALFAGDQRSLRLREQDEMVQGVKADVVVTSLAQLVECVSEEKSNDG